MRWIVLGLVLILFSEFSHPASASEDEYYGGNTWESNSGPVFFHGEVVLTSTQWTEDLSVGNSTAFIGTASEFTAKMYGIHPNVNDVQVDNFHWYQYDGMNMTMCLFSGEMEPDESFSIFSLQDEMNNTTGLANAYLIEYSPPTSAPEDEYYGENTWESNSGSVFIHGEVVLASTPWNDNLSDANSSEFIETASEFTTTMYGIHPYVTDVQVLYYHLFTFDGIDMTMCLFSGEIETDENFNVYSLQEKMENTTGFAHVYVYAEWTPQTYTDYTWVQISGHVGLSFVPWDNAFDDPLSIGFSDLEMNFTTTMYGIHFNVYYVQVNHFSPASPAMSTTVCYFEGEMYVDASFDLVSLQVEMENTAGFENASIAESTPPTNYSSGHMGGHFYGDVVLLSRHWNNDFIYTNSAAFNQLALNFTTTMLDRFYPDIWSVRVISFSEYPFGDEIVTWASFDGTMGDGHYLNEYEMQDAMNNLADFSYAFVQGWSYVTETNHSDHANMEVEFTGYVVASTFDWTDALRDHTSTEYHDLEYNFTAMVYDNFPEVSHIYGVSFELIGESSINCSFYGGLHVSQQFDIWTFEEGLHSMTGFESARIAEWTPQTYTDYTWVQISGHVGLSFVPWDNAFDDPLSIGFSDLEMNFTTTMYGIHFNVYYVQVNHFSPASPASPAMSATVCYFEGEMYVDASFNLILLQVEMENTAGFENVSVAESTPPTYTDYSSGHMGGHFYGDVVLLSRHWNNDFIYNNSTAFNQLALNFTTTMLDRFYPDIWSVRVISFSEYPFGDEIVTWASFDGTIGDGHYLNKYEMQDAMNNLADFSYAFVQGWNYETETNHSDHEYMEDKSFCGYLTIRNWTWTEDLANNSSEYFTSLELGLAEKVNRTAHDRGYDLEFDFFIITRFLPGDLGEAEEGEDGQEVIGEFVLGLYLYPNSDVPDTINITTHLFESIGDIEAATVDICGDWTDESDSWNNTHIVDFFGFVELSADWNEALLDHTSPAYLDLELNFTTKVYHRFPEVHYIYGVSFEYISPYSINCSFYGGFMPSDNLNIWSLEEGLNNMPDFSSANIEESIHSANASDFDDYDPWESSHGYVYFYGEVVLTSIPWTGDLYYLGSTVFNATALDFTTKMHGIHSYISAVQVNHFSPYINYDMNWTWCSFEGASQTDETFNIYSIQENMDNTTGFAYAYVAEWTPPTYTDNTWVDFFGFVELSADWNEALLDHTSPAYLDLELNFTTKVYHRFPEVHYIYGVSFEYISPDSINCSFYGGFVLSDNLNIWSLEEGLNNMPDFSSARVEEWSYETATDYNDYGHIQGQFIGGVVLLSRHWDNDFYNLSSTAFNQLALNFTTTMLDRFYPDIWSVRVISLSVIPFGDENVTWCSFDGTIGDGHYLDKYELQDAMNNLADFSYAFVQGWSYETETNHSDHEYMEDKSFCGYLTIRNLTWTEDLADNSSEDFTSLELGLAEKVNRTAHDRGYDLEFDFFIITRFLPGDLGEAEEGEDGQEVIGEFVLGLYLYPNSDVPDTINITTHLFESIGDIEAATVDICGDWTDESDSWNNTHIVKMLCGYLDMPDVTWEENLSDNTSLDYELFQQILIAEVNRTAIDNGYSREYDQFFITRLMPGEQWGEGEGEGRGVIVEYGLFLALDPHDDIFDTINTTKHLFETMENVDLAIVDECDMWANESDSMNRSTLVDILFCGHLDMPDIVWEENLSLTTSPEFFNLAHYLTEEVNRTANDNGYYNEYEHFVVVGFTAGVQDDPEMQGVTADYELQLSLDHYDGITETINITKNLFETIGEVNFATVYECDIWTHENGSTLVDETFCGNLTLPGENWQPELSDDSSPAFKALEYDLQLKVEAIETDDDGQLAYISLNISRFIQLSEGLGAEYELNLAIPPDSNIEDTLDTVEDLLGSVDVVDGVSTYVCDQGMDEPHTMSSSTTTSNSSTTPGTISTATGSFSTTTGNFSATTGTISTATGSFSTTTGNFSATTGISSTTTSSFSTTTGSSSMTTGTISTTPGSFITTTGTSRTTTDSISTTTGSSSMTTGTSSTTTGSSSTTTGSFGTTTGSSSTTTGTSSTTTGSSSTTTGSISTTTGTSSTTTDDSSTTPGSISTATGSSSMITGSISTTTGTTSTTAGDSSTTTGSTSTTTGSFNTATGSTRTSTGTISTTTGSIITTTGRTSTTPGSTSTPTGSFRTTIGSTSTATVSISTTTGSSSTTTDSISTTTGSTRTTPGSTSTATVSISTPYGSTGTATVSISTATGSSSTTTDSISTTTGSTRTTPGSTSTAAVSISTPTGSSTATGSISTTTGSISTTTGSTSTTTGSTSTTTDSTSTTPGSTSTATVSISTTPDSTSTTTGSTSTTTGSTSTTTGFAFDSDVDVTIVFGVVEVDGVSKNAWRCGFELENEEANNYEFEIEWKANGDTVYTSNRLPKYAADSFYVTGDVLAGSGFAMEKEYVCSVKAYQPNSGVDGGVVIGTSPSLRPLEFPTKDITMMRGGEANFTFIINIPLPGGPTCCIYIKTYVPDDNHNCEDSTLAPKNMHTCGLRVCGSSDNSTGIVGSGTIRFTTIINHKWFLKNYFAFKVRFDISGPAEDFWVGQSSEDFSVSVSDENDFWKGSLCYSTNDPQHISFDWLFYSSMRIAGIFTMYRHDVYPVEVQITTEYCGSIWGVATCTCGVAIRSGTEVFISDHCSGQHTTTHITQTSSGLNYVHQSYSSHYEIYLPHGALVSVWISPPNWFNFTILDVLIIPSPDDMYKVTGMCGTLNENVYDDLTYRDGYVEPEDYSWWQMYGWVWKGVEPTAFALSWKLTEDMSLWDDATLQTLTDWSDDETYCVCKGSDGLGELVCSKHELRTCNNVEAEINVDEDNEEDEEAEAAFIERRSVDTRKKMSIRKKREFKRRKMDPAELNRRMELRRQKRSTITPLSRKKRQAPASSDDVVNSEAYIRCRELLQDNCGGVFQSNITVNEDKIIACTLDTQADSETAWNKTACATATAVMQNTIDSDTSLDPAEVAAATAGATSCPNMCNFQGTCMDDKTCDCYEGYGSDQCDLVLVEGVVVVYNGLTIIHISQSQASLSFMAENGIANSGTAICRFSHTAVTLPDNIQVYEGDTDNTAAVIDIYEFECIIPQASRRRRRSTGSGSSIAVDSYQISVSNDGEHFGNTVEVTVLDTTCITYNTTSGTATLDANYCLIEGTCYEYDVNQTETTCNYCDVSLNVYDWSLRSGFCLIDDACVANGTTNSGDACRYCHVDADSDDWTLDNETESCLSTDSSGGGTEGYVIAIIVIVVLVVVGAGALGAYFLWQKKMKTRWANRGLFDRVRNAKFPLRVEPSKREMLEAEGIHPPPLHPPPLYPTAGLSTEPIPGSSSMPDNLYTERELFNRHMSVTPVMPENVRDSARTPTMPSIEP